MGKVPGKCQHYIGGSDGNFFTSDTYFCEIDKFVALPKLDQPAQTVENSRSLKS